MKDDIDQRLAALDLVLPQPPTPAAHYASYMVEGERVHISGQLPMRDGQVIYRGRVGEDIRFEDAQAAAHLCGINILAQLKKACDGDLNRVGCCVKLGGFIQAGPDFTDHPKVMDGVSRLMGDLFGAGHARFAVGCSSLPFGASVEVEALFTINLTEPKGK